MTITLPNPIINYIHNLEPVDSSVTNRPMIQIFEDLIYLRDQTETKFTDHDGQLSSLNSALAALSGVDGALLSQIQALYDALTASLTAPVNPNLGDQWKTVDGEILVWNSTFWEPISRVYIQDTTPAQGREGLAWWNRVNNKLYFHDGFAWQEFVSGGSTTGGNIVVASDMSEQNFIATANQTFIPVTLAATDKIQVFVNSLIMNTSVDYNYDTTGVTFTNPLTADELVKVVIFSVPQNILTSVTQTVVNGSVIMPELSTQTLTLGQTTIPYASQIGDVVYLHINGIMLEQGLDYTMDLTTITLLSPASDNTLNITRFSAANAIAVGAGSSAWADITGKPTTIAGYGITDAASATHSHTFASLTSKPTTVSGYGITDAYNKAEINNLLATAGGSGSTVISSVLPVSSAFDITDGQTIVNFASAANDVVYVFVDGVLHEETLDYTKTTTDITFLVPLTGLSRVKIIKYVYVQPNPIVASSNTYQIDVASLVLTHTKNTTATVHMVYIDGILQSESSYTMGSTSITFVTELPIGVEVRIVSL